MHAQLVAAGITMQNSMNSATVACCCMQVKPGHVGLSDVKVDQPRRRQQRQLHLGLARRNGVLGTATSSAHFGPWRSSCRPTT